MNVIIYLIPISIGLGLCGLLGFFWSVRTRQYEDLETDAIRALSAEDIPMNDEQRRILRD